MQIVPVALPEEGDSYHCCQAAGEDIYERFLNSSNICTHSVLLHPVRTFSPFHDVSLLCFAMVSSELPSTEMVCILVLHSCEAATKPDDSLCSSYFCVAVQFSSWQNQADEKGRSQLGSIFDMVHTEQVKLCGEHWERDNSVTQHSISTWPTYGPKNKLC